MKTHSAIQNITALICPCCKHQLPQLSDLNRLHGKVQCSSCLKEFSVFSDVPILVRDSVEADNLINGKADANEPFRDKSAMDFYYKHYSGRSRKVDLESDYLLEERLFLQSFVKERSISGVCLEVGCRTGIFADVASQYIGLDYSLSSVFADGFEGYTRIVASAENIPLSDSSVQLVFSFNTLEHIPDPKIAFDEINRILLPGGYAVLKPAWHCTRYNVELLPVKQYGELDFYQKIRKALMPVFRNKLFKLVTRLPKRIERRCSCLIRSSQPTTLRYRKLIPYLGDEFFISDCDATADIDVHEGILYFESRGYQIISHTSIWKKLLAGSDLIIVQKSLS